MVRRPLRRLSVTHHDRPLPRPHCVLFAATKRLARLMHLHLARPLRFVVILVEGKRESHRQGRAPSLVEPPRCPRAFIEEAAQ